MILFSSKELIEQRKQQCDICPSKQKTVVGDKCKECGCLLFAKRKLKLEKCPLNKWNF